MPTCVSRPILKLPGKGSNISAGRGSDPPFDPRGRLHATTPSGPTKRSTYPAGAPGGNRLGITPTRGSRSNCPPRRRFSAILPGPALPQPRGVLARWAVTDTLPSLQCLGKAPELSSVADGRPPASPRFPIVVSSALHHLDRSYQDRARLTHFQSFRMWMSMSESSADSKTQAMMSPSASLRTWAKVKSLTRPVR